MTSSMAPLLLMLGPLAAYFAVQGFWHCVPRPRLVSGTVDYLLMTFGLGALLAYGPIGEFLLRIVFRSPGVYAQLAWISLLTTTALVLAGPAHRRLLIYNIDPARVQSAVREALARVPGEFSTTLHGFEDRTVGRGVTLKTSERFHTAEIEAFGRRADELILALVPPLRDRLAADRRRPDWPIALAWFALALATLTGPIALRMTRADSAGRSSTAVPARHLESSSLLGVDLRVHHPRLSDPDHDLDSSEPRVDIRGVTSRNGL